MRESLARIHSNSKVSEAKRYNYDGVNQQLESPIMNEIDTNISNFGTRHNLENVHEFSLKKNHNLISNENRTLGQKHPNALTEMNPNAFTNIRSIKEYKSVKNFGKHGDNFDSQRAGSNDLSSLARSNG